MYSLKRLVDVTRAGTFVCIASCSSTDGLTSDVSPATYAKLCGIPEVPSQAARLPVPTGSHCVGKTSAHVVDPQRPEWLPPLDQRPRELMLKIWYPATADAGGQSAAYADPGTLATIARGGGLSFEADVQTNAKHAVAMAQGETFPVVLFSPGLNAVSEVYLALLEDLASRGFIVVGVDHPYISARTVFPDGRVTESKVMRGDDVSAQVAVDDLRSVLDWLHGLDAAAPGTPISGHIDTQRIGAVGHSFGGSAALQATRVDDRLRAAVDIDGRVQGQVDVPWPKPLLFLLSEHHTITADPTLEAVWQRRPRAGALESLPGAGHLDFSDLKILLGPVHSSFDAEMLDRLSLGPVDVMQAVSWTRDRTGRFLETHVARIAE